MIKFDKLNPYEKKETTAEIVLITIWDDLGNIKELGQLNCENCKKIFNFLEQRYS